MSQNGYLFTCEICGEGKMSETAMQTHVYLAHVYSEIACMFCDLRGVTAEEMTLHINSVHCSDHVRDNDASHNGLQQHLNVVQHDNQSTNQKHVTQLPASSDGVAVHPHHQTFVHLVDSSIDSGQTGRPDASSVSFAPNYDTETGSRHILSRESPGNVCEMDRDKRQKRKLSDTVIAFSSCSERVKNDSRAFCVSSDSGAEVTSSCRESLSTSLSLPKTTVANGTDQTFHVDRFVKCNYLYVQNENCCRVIS